MATVTIGGTIGQSFRFVAVAWRRATAIMVTAVVLLSAMQVVQLANSRVPLVSFVSFVVSLAVSAAVLGALFRIGLEADHPGDPNYAVHPGGLQWGPPEWRVLGANLLIGVIAVVAFTAVVIAWAIAFGVSMKDHPQALSQLNGAGTSMAKLGVIGGWMMGPLGVLSAVILIPSLIAFIYVGSRLSLFTILAVDTRSFDLGKAWVMARGAVITLIVATVVIYAAQLLLGVICGAGAGAIAGAIGHADQAQSWGSVLGQAVGAAISGPLLAGMQIYVYRAQAGPRGVVDVFA